MDKILCCVITEPVYSNNICTYKVDVQGRTFTVVSKNRQAVKDNIFITGNQKLEIEGDVVDDTIFTIKSIIKLK